MLEVFLLGTASMFPTKERSHSATLLRYEGESLLFDAGEGVQRQLIIMKLTPWKISRIFLTHWHGDHCLGLAGLLDSLRIKGRSHELEIYGPKGTEEHFNNLLKSFSIIPSFKVKIVEVDLKINEMRKIVNTKKYEVQACGVDHNQIPCNSYSFIEKPRLKINTKFLSKYGLKTHPLLSKLQKGEPITWEGRRITPEEGTIKVPGKKFSYVMDTKPCSGIKDLVKDSDLLICEATYMKSHEKMASERGHMTAGQAGRIAAKSNVNKLVLTHFSDRYDDLKPLLEEAKKFFPKTVLGKDFMKILLK